MHEDTRHWNANKNVPTYAADFTRLWILGSISSDSAALQRRSPVVSLVGSPSRTWTRQAGRIKYWVEK